MTEDFRNAFGGWQEPAKRLDLMTRSGFVFKSTWYKRPYTGANGKLKKGPAIKNHTIRKARVVDSLPEA